MVSEWVSKVVLFFKDSSSRAIVSGSRNHRVLGFQYKVFDRLLFHAAVTPATAPSTAPCTRAKTNGASKPLQNYSILNHMMSIDSFLLFISACFALNLAPGPNNILSISNATRYGFWAASVAGVGRLVAFVGMIAIAALGLATVLQASILFFHGIRVLGAGYLFYLAFQLWGAPPSERKGGDDKIVSPRIRVLARQEFFVAVGNPKAILIFTAFLPQFVDLSKPVGAQFAILGLFFLSLEWIAIAVYAYIGSHLRNWLAAPERERLLNRVFASVLGVGAIGLLVSKRTTATTV